jgi:hypothetical protein
VSSTSAKIPHYDICYSFWITSAVTCWLQNYIWRREDKVPAFSLRDDIGSLFQCPGAGLLRGKSQKPHLWGVVMPDESFDAVIIGDGSKALYVAMSLVKHAGMSVGIFQNTMWQGAPSWCLNGIQGYRGNGDSR